MTQPPQWESPPSPLQSGWGAAPSPYEPPPAVPTRDRWFLNRWVIAAVVFVVGWTIGAAGGGGAGGATQAAPTRTVTMTAPAATMTVTAPPVSSTAATAQATAAASPTRRSKVTVPNGVGLNYQAAQDLWRAVGLIVMPATDATGQGRLPVLDSNWVVLGQTPKAGTVVAWNSEITATVKKYSDG